MMGRSDDLLAELAGSLRGRRRPVEDVLDELRGGLEDAVEAQSRRGVARAVAERVAVEEFGSVELLAPPLQDTLAVEEGRRAALVTVGVLAAQPVVWSGPVTELVWVGSRPGTTDWLLAPMAVIGCTVMALLAVGWLLSRWSLRTVGRGRQFARAVAIAVGLSVTSLGALGVARSAAGLDAAAAGPRLAWATVALFVPLAWAGRAAWLAWWAAPVRRASASG